MNTGCVFHTIHSKGTKNLSGVISQQKAKKNIEHVSKVTPTPQPCPQTIVQ